MDAYMYIQAMHKGAFVEVAEVDGELYGTTVQALAKEQNAGRVHTHTHTHTHTHSHTHSHIQAQPPNPKP